MQQFIWLTDQCSSVEVSDCGFSIEMQNLAMIVFSEKPTNRFMMTHWYSEHNSSDSDIVCLFLFSFIFLW